MDLNPVIMQQSTMASTERTNGTYNRDTNSMNNIKPPQFSAFQPLSFNSLFIELPSSRSKENPTETKKGQKVLNVPNSKICSVFNIQPEQRTRRELNASLRICEEISTSTGALIEFLDKSGTASFLVTGKADEVAEAKKGLYEKFQMDTKKQYVKIPKDHYRFLLGKKGKNIQTMEESTGTKVTVPTSDSSAKDITVIGPKEGIERVVYQIKLLSDEVSKDFCEKVEIPKIYHPFINPLLNEELSKALSGDDVRMNMPPASLASTEVIIAGEPEAVAKVKAIVQKIHKDMEAKSQVVSVEVNKNQHKNVLGFHKANVSEILTKTKVSVEVPPVDSSSETITLRGPQNKLGAALTMLYEKANSMSVIKIAVPLWLHKFIIGKDGLKQLVQIVSIKVGLEFIGSGGFIVLEGPPEDVEVAAKRMEARAKQMQRDLTFKEPALDSQYFKFIIGKKGANINRIRDSFGIEIQLNEVENYIRIEGTHSGVAKALQEIETVRNMENEREVLIDHNFHRHLIGAKGEKIKEIRDRFNQVQILFPDSSSNSDSVRVRGSKEDVELTCQHLTQLGKDLVESHFQLTVSIQRQFHKFVIGKAGATINKIREETNTRIDLPQEGLDSDDIVITGRKSNCEKARTKIRLIERELASIEEVELNIPCKFHNAVIGAGGKQIQKISEDCGGVSIKFPPSEANSDVVLLRGSKDDVKKAKAKLLEISAEKQLNNFTETLKAKAELHRFLIGRSGANIRKIRDRTGARIVFPTEKDSEDDTILIIGKEESVKDAAEELRKMISDLSNVVEETVTVDPKYHKHFVARRGDVLKQIAEKVGEVTISFPRQGVESDRVTIKGLADSVAAAKIRLLEIVDDLSKMVTMEVIIPQKFHRNIMGPRGSKVMSLTSDYDVQIKFPEKNLNGVNEEEETEATETPLPNGTDDGSPKPQDIVTIQGRQEKCEAAKAAMLAMVPITEEVEVAFKLHRYIIGLKGETVRTLMTDHDVSIQVPPAAEEKDSIWLTGPPECVKGAREAIAKLLLQRSEEEKDREQRSFQLRVDIDPEYHPKIIGRKGTVISKIREKYVVNVQFPSRTATDGEERIIVITGYQEKCEKAKEAILTITGDLESLLKKPVYIDERIHSRLIGARGKTVRKIMDDFKVEIKFPREGDNPDEVVVIGSPKEVDDCIDHLLNLEEEFLQDVQDRELLNGRNKPKQPTKVEPVEPWNQSTPDMKSSSDFPCMSKEQGKSTDRPSWGPRRGAK